VALALTLRASKTDFSLPRPTLQAIGSVTNKAREPSRRSPQSAGFIARGARGLAHTTGGALQPRPWERGRLNDPPGSSRARAPFRTMRCRPESLRRY